MLAVCDIMLCEFLCEISMSFLSSAVFLSFNYLEHSFAQDQAIVNSIFAVNKPDLVKKLFASIFVTGGTALIPGKNGT